MWRREAPGTGPRGLLSVAVGLVGNVWSFRHRCPGSTLRPRNRVGTSQGFSWVRSLYEGIYPGEVRGHAVRQLPVVLAARERPVRLVSCEGREPLDVALEPDGLGLWVSPDQLRHSVGEFFQVVYLRVAGGPGGYVRLQPVFQRLLGGAQHCEVVGVYVYQRLHRSVPAVGVRHPVSGFLELLAVIAPEFPCAVPFPSVLALGSGHEDSLPRCAGCRVVDAAAALQFILAGGHRY